ncbi:hypothetical protein V6N12_071438 [Hibiscus sabdariffa]|uniref:Phytocyanin domain-containing protein n=1 Tax=Hibiscus sabdariffa TaxID=183260 RepID=A0ABR2FJU8_9ROSI
MNVSVKASKQHRIGWQQPNTDVYTQWATSRRFHVGDSLSFEYRNDSVLVVDKWDYYHCNSINPIYSFDDGSTVINLDRPGFFYFISGVLDHCEDGQKLMIQVMGLHQRPQPPPPPATANPQDVITALILRSSPSLHFLLSLESSSLSSNSHFRTQSYQTINHWFPAS